MHRIAFKIALVVALTTGAIGSMAAAAAGSVSFAFPLFTALVAGLAAFGVTNRLLVSRLKRLEAALDELREEGGRTDGMPSGDDDEIDVLLRRADQASIAVRRRIGELKRSENHRREYVGDVSHELKTPIFAIQGFAETLLNGALEDRAVSRGFVKKILQNAGRLNALAKDLADVARLESGALELAMAPLDVARIMEEVRESLDLAARAKKIDVRIEVEDGVARARGDRERIRQVLTNLVDNAIKYTNPGGWVRLRAEADAPGVVRLAVIDNGIGIGEEHVHRVTERFYRADKSRSRVQGGTGLGLAIVKHILAAHRTSIAIESAVGRGSTFSFTLPAA